MRREERDREFADFVASRGATLRRLAYLVSGDLDIADDLTQTALTKLYVAWPRVRLSSSPEAYARQTLVRTHIDEKRRPWRRERAYADLPEHVGPDPQASFDEADALARELWRLPPGQRTAVVLRFWLDLSVEDSARAMNCSTSTVKSQCARGLARLRAALEPAANGGAPDDKR